VWLSPRKPNSVDVSDVLLFDPAGREVGDLESAMQTALPEDAVTRGKLGMYWEIYGLARADSALPVSLTLTPVGRSALRRLSESIGLAQRTSPLNIAWRDTPGAESVSARSVVLDFSLVPRGRYELRVEVRPAGQAAASSTRTIQLQ
jgi:hypothetical protein